MFIYMKLGFNFQEKDSVCLADFCEIFRCDVVSGAAQATFWDVALCMEEDMKDLTQDCLVNVLVYFLFLIFCCVCLH